MIRKLFLIGLPLFLFTTQQIQADDTATVMKQLAIERKQYMEKYKDSMPKPFNVAEYIQDNKLTANGMAELTKFIQSYMYIIENNSQKVPDAYKLHGLDPIEDGRSVPDPRSGLKAIDYQVGPFNGTLFNQDPLRFRVIWSYGRINFSAYYRNTVPFTITNQDLSSIGLVFEKINLIGFDGYTSPESKSYFYIYHSRSNPDLKVSFCVDYINYPKHPPATLPKFIFIQISKGDFLSPGYILLGTVSSR